MALSKPTVGFIGLGLMGNAITKRLVECGYQVFGYDIEASKITAAEQHGVIACASLSALTANVDIAILCVTSTTVVEEIVRSADGLLNQPGGVRLVIDHSTTTVEATRALAAQLQTKHGINWIDAPVSGGPPAALTGTLAVMVGASDADFETAAPVISAIAASCTHMGVLGAGQVTKMVNQILVLNNYCVLAEAFTLAEAGGVDASKIPAALGAGHAGSNLLNTMFPRLVERDFAPAGYARQVLKDLDMVQALARTLDVPTPMSAQANTLFRMLVSKGYGELDGIAVQRLYDREATLSSSI